jgi:SAM-dependent methyltransferase
MSEQQVVATGRDLAVQREFWNCCYADSLQDGSPNPARLRRGQVVVQLLRSLNLSKPNILEVGCATGCLAAALAQFGRVTGVDLADQLIATAKGRHPHIGFLAGDFLTVALPAEHFDLVVSVDVISYFDDLRLFTDRIASLLKSRGHLILTCPHRFIWNRTDFIRRSHGEIPLNWLNMGEMKRLLRDRFTVLHTETIMPEGNLGILRLINSGRLNSLVRKVVPEPYIVKLKEGLGLGKTLVAVAQKRA